MNNTKLIDLNRLQTIMEEVLGVFQNNNLNDLEMSLVISELARLNKSYQIIQDKKVLTKGI